MTLACHCGGEIWNESLHVRCATVQAKLVDAIRVYAVSAFPSRNEFSDAHRQRQPLASS